MNNVFLWPTFSAKTNMAELDLKLEFQHTVASYNMRPHDLRYGRIL